MITASFDAYHLLLEVLNSNSITSDEIDTLKDSIERLELFLDMITDSDR